MKTTKITNTIVGVTVKLSVQHAKIASTAIVGMKPKRAARAEILHWISTSAKSKGWKRME